MHVCFINMPIEFYSPVSGGAIGTVTAQLARRLSSRGHRISVLTPLDANPTYKVGEVIGVRSAATERSGLVRRIWENVRGHLNRWDWPRFGLYLDSVIRMLRRMDTPDVVIVHNDLVLPAYIRASVPRVRTLAYLHNEWRSRFRRVRSSLAAVDHFVCVSDYIRTWTIQNWAVPEDRITTILNGADTDAFRPADWFPNRPWRELRVLYVGRLDPNKGVDLVIEAVRRLRAEGIDARFAFAGPVWWHGVNTKSDPYYQRLQSASDGINGHYLGTLTRDQVPSTMRESDVVCVPSRSEDPCPLVLGEAMASGCAVLGSTRGGIPQLCGGAAMLVSPENSDGITAALRKLAREPMELAEMRVRALNLARSLAWDGQAAVLERLMVDGS